MPFPRHRSKKPIHNVKDGRLGQMPKDRLSPARSDHWDRLAAANWLPHPGKEVDDLVDPRLAR